ncbi:hypothetical protein P7C70_g1076, partial [Phenoliferia sp. Uapishka_3]
MPASAIPTLCGPETEPTFTACLPHLRISVIGAGIGGLATALACSKAGFRDVTVYESANEIAEVGAGIQLPPNETRILRRLGVLEALRPSAVALSKNSLRRYANDAVLGETQLMPSVEEKYGAPLWVAHRADLQRVLREGCEAAVPKVTIKTASRVSEVDFPGTRIKIGEQWIESDVILVGDGVKSHTRAQLLELHGQRDMPHETGDAAYRIIIPREDLESDPELLAYVESSVGYRWMGPGGHIMAYPMKAHTVFNMVLLHPDVNNTSESWTSKGSKKEMLEFYKDWNPIVKRFLAFVKADEVMEWKLNDHAPLPTWTENHTALLGDACHPMLPYVAQGAAQAVEDGACLAAALAFVDDVSRVPNALAGYESVRKDRAEKIQASAAATKASLHLPDGPKQEQRDELIRAAEHGGANPDKWSDSTWQQFMWGTDSTRDMLALIHEVKSGLAKAKQEAEKVTVTHNF